MKAEVWPSGFGYFDDLTWYQAPLVTPFTATKGMPTRVIWSTSLPGVVTPYIYIALTEAEKFKGGVRNTIDQTFAAGENTAPGVGYRTVAMTWDLTTLKVYVDGAVEATTGAVVGTVAGVTEQTIGAIRPGITGHGFDDDIGDVIEWSRALSAANVVAAHAQLKRLYPSLV